MCHVCFIRHHIVSETQEARESGVHAAEQLGNGALDHGEGAPGGARRPLRRPRGPEPDRAQAKGTAPLSPRPRWKIKLRTPAAVLSSARKHAKKPANPQPAATREVALRS